MYEEVIKKDTGLAGVLGNLGTEEPSSSTSPEAMVPVIAPDGRKGVIPASKLQAALKRGYKQR